MSSAHFFKHLSRRRLAIARRFWLCGVKRRNSSDNMKSSSLRSSLSILFLMIAITLAFSAVRVPTAGDPCTVPGVSIVTDPAGDTGTGTVGNVPGAPSQDITEVFIAEPGQTDGERRLSVTIKV